MWASPPTNPIGELVKICWKGAPLGGAPVLLLWDILFFDVPPEKRGNLRPGKRRLGIQVLAIIAL